MEDIGRGESEDTSLEVSKQFEEVEGQLSAVERENAELGNHLSPIYKLPDELLVEIWKYKQSQETSGIITSSFPFAESWVTRRWRSVSLNAPTLWCRIHLSVYQSDHEVETRLARSNNCLLSITMRIDHSHIFRHLQRLEHLLFIASDHVHRWRSFSLTCDLVETSDIRSMETILDLIRPAHAPQLTHLAVECNQTLGLPLMPILTGGAPILSQAVFEGIDIRLYSTLLTGLASVEIVDIPSSGRPTHQEIRDFLHASPSLTALRICGVCVEYDFTTISSYPTIHVPSLRSLTICGGSAYDDEHDFVVRFYGALSTPRLKSLTLESVFWSGIGAFVYTATVGAPLSKYPHLSNLSLLEGPVLDPDGEEDYTIPLLLCFPLIDHLQLMGADITCFLSPLTSYRHVPGHPNEALCPRLRTLTWLRCSRSSASFMQRLISMRSSMAIPIPRLRVDRKNFETLDCDSREWFCANVDVELHTDLE